jgi:hypothetical protein
VGKAALFLISGQSRQQECWDHVSLFVPLDGYHPDKPEYHGIAVEGGLMALQSAIGE